ncbi:MAG: TlpA family protein disulfide reductase [Sphingobacteriaceae bacterium]|nr:TlpA family protein disulfide reductase [Sphingobacteriaceae bacterium]
MKKTLVIILILFSTSALLGQNKSKTEAFIIQGQITNCPEKQLKISFRDENQQILTDTLNLDGSGNFYLKTFKVKQPQLTNIKKNNIQINDFFVAPGYNLTITADGKDFLSLLKTTKISGIGSESNNYRSIHISIALARMDTTKRYKLNETDLLAYIKRDQTLKDSIAHIVFDRNSEEDKYLKYFGSLVRLDNEFMKLYMLLDRVLYVKWNKFNPEKSTSFLRANFDNKILDNLCRDEFLISANYRNYVIKDEYLDYLINLDYKKDSTLRNQKGYKLKKANETYQGKVKEFVLYELMESLITLSKSFEELNDHKEQIKAYLSNLKNPYYTESLTSKLAEKEAELFRTQVGKPAPKFTLKSNLGKTYSLDDFKGKVVYIDLWASWCGPCRQETPYLKILYEKYKSDKRIAFIGIGVHDGINEWKKAIEKDAPEGIQLLDAEGTVKKGYVANTIPQFILVDKQGNIVNFDAPRPSEGKKIEKLIDAEIAK